MKIFDIIDFSFEILIVYSQAFLISISKYVGLKT